jgi:hypothetical protein
LRKKISPMRNGVRQLARPRSLEIRAHRTKKGYLRISNAGPYRNKYVHRFHVERMLKEVWHPYFGDRLPGDIAVYHQDWDKEHNCSCNYLILDQVIHGSIEQSRLLRDERGRYKRILRKKRKGVQ